LPLPPTTREALLEAMRRYDDELRQSSEWRNWRNDRTHRYAISHGGRLYPVKKVIRLALAAAGSDTPRFGGGTEANGYARQYGFEVVTLRGNAWIFQGNPSVYDVAGAVDVLPELNWSTRQYASQVQIGDRVYLWESGKQAGVLAVATVLTEPHEMIDSEPERQFERRPEALSGDSIGVRLRIDRVLSERILRQDLLRHPMLRELPIIRMPRQSNYRLTPEHVEALDELIEEESKPNERTASRARSSPSSTR
jgi:hypothetical protein